MAWRRLMKRSPITRLPTYVHTNTCTHTITHRLTNSSRPSQRRANTTDSHGDEVEQEQEQEEDSDEGRANLDYKYKTRSYMADRILNAIWRRHRESEWFKRTLQENKDR